MLHTLHAGQTGLGAIHSISTLLLRWERAKCQRDFMPETEELRLRSSPSPQTTLANTLPPMAPADSVKKGNLPAKQKKLNCGSVDHSERLNRAQLSSSSKGALQLASNKKKKRIEKDIYSSRADIVCRKVRWNSASLLWSWQSFHDHRAQPQASF